MSAQPKNPRTVIRNKTIKQMKALGIYNPSFDGILDVYVDLLFEYKTKYEDFKLAGYKVSEQYTNNKGGESERKTPLYLTIENLRKDILSYSSQLGLTTKACVNVKGELPSTSKKVSSLSSAMGDD